MVSKAVPMQTRVKALLVAALVGVAVLVQLGGSRVAADERLVVHMVAERFSFRPSQIRMRPGDTLELHVRSDDTTHGFKIFGTGIDVRVPKRGRGEVTVVFSPTEPGEYRFECSKLCGAGHNFMRGAIIVEDGDGST